MPAAGRGGVGRAEAAGAQVRAGWAFRPGRGGTGPRLGLQDGPAPGPELPEGQEPAPCPPSYI